MPSLSHRTAPHPTPPPLTSLGSHTKCWLISNRCPLPANRRRFYHALLLPSVKDPPQATAFRYQGGGGMAAWAPPHDPPPTHIRK